MNLPEKFKERIYSQLGSEADDFFSSLSKPPCISIRINPFKPTAKFNTYERVAWCEHGRFLPARPSFTHDPLFHAGTYYVQEASSMFLSEIFKQLFPQKPDLKILDLCASPGGKSTLILSEISPDSLLVANETIRNRIPPLLENIVKWGVPNVFISNNDAKDFAALNCYFDVILVDAPCSGEGLFRKDANSVREWSHDNIQLCSARQKRILAEVADSLKDNGILIYTTCTFSEEENEKNIKFIITQTEFEPIKIPLKHEWGQIVETSVFENEKKIFCYRFYPHKTKGEGFFISVLRKKKTENNIKLRTDEPEKVSEKEKRIISGVVINVERFEFFHWKNSIHAVSHFDDLRVLRRLNLKFAGICIGRIVKDEFLPSHDFALSSIISKNIQSIELNESDAIKYLKKETLKITTNLKGWTLARYSGFNLGWMKILENRINNYYPKNIRILKT